MLKWIFISLFFVSSLGFARESNNFYKLIQQRHSGYSFDRNKNVSFDLMVQLADAARLSPSSYNEQPWRFIFCDRIRTADAHEKALSCLADANQKWAKNAPLLIIVLANTISERTQGMNQYAHYDTGAAAISLIYQATALGLLAHEMGGFDLNRLKENFSIPNEILPLSVIAVGYESLNEASNLLPRSRKPIGESSFLGELGNKLIK